MENELQHVVRILTKAVNYIQTGHKEDGDWLIEAIGYLHDYREFHGETNDAE